MRAGLGSCPKILGAVGLAVAENITCLLEGRCGTSLPGEDREGQRRNSKKLQKTNNLYFLHPHGLGLPKRWPAKGSKGIRKESHEAGNTS